jgi:hypothetical protein
MTATAIRDAQTTRPPPQDVDAGASAALRGKIAAEVRFSSGARALYAIDSS